jgi:hypothetical protein
MHNKSKQHIKPHNIKIHVLVLKIYDQQQPTNVTLSHVRA